MPGTRPDRVTLQKKICMVGSYGVGKTSLVRRFVESIFSDNYLTNIGVRIDKKTIPFEAYDVNLVLWDLAGEDEISALKPSQLRGASGYIVVADGTRPATVDKALELQLRVATTLGGVPFVFALNKVDLSTEWQFSAPSIADLEANLRAKGADFFLTSAKTGDAVELMFRSLALKMLHNRQ